MFEEISPAPPDAILGLTDAFQADPNPEKINLGVGVFMDDAGKTPILNSVKKAENLLLEGEITKSYLPISGSPQYASGIQELLFSQEHPFLKAGRVKTAQTPGGTGGLRVGADFLKLFYPEATVWVSSPTWANHKAIFKAAGFPAKEYPYYDPETRGLDFDGMAAALAKIPSGDIVLLHVCCHNPTGVDPSEAQWQQIADLAETQGWVPFFDFAYQGFGASVEADRRPLHLFAERGLDFLVSSSCSKNFGLYNERTGAFTLVAQNADRANAAFSHVKTVIRSNYSNPPRHGGAIVEVILNDKILRKEWLGELDAMRKRIRFLRTELVRGLQQRGVDADFSYIEQQNGMFSFSGLNETQVKRLREEHSIYIVGGGRINVAGMTSDALNRLCDAVAKVL
ncbi:MAG: aspartate/tyrosine/aromatic aminotransferase [Verrucomicrobia bacterium]|nr:aspartate/tyrosine/aromatic aminotransferase [Verrucomicrobiota bacterium]MCH8513083.1 aspartate/tyrosine/aromatic aminotransferase [Kiritimatiellia bacterium]